MINKPTHYPQSVIVWTGTLLIMHNRSPCVISVNARQDRVSKGLCWGFNSNLSTSLQSFAYVSAQICSPETCFYFLIEEEVIRENHHIDIFSLFEWVHLLLILLLEQSRKKSLLWSSAPAELARGKKETVQILFPSSEPSDRTSAVGKYLLLFIWKINKIPSKN